MAALSSSLLSMKSSQAHFLSPGLSLKPTDHCVLHVAPYNLSSKAKLGSRKQSLSVRASGDSRGSNSAGIFVGGFILGGIVAGTLGCVYAPQISKVLVGERRKELMKKLPKFIYDEEKIMEKNRRIIEEKIAQLNSAIDDASGKRIK